MNANEIRINPALVFTPLALAGILQATNAVFTETAIGWIKAAAWCLMLVVIGIMAHLMFKMHAHFRRMLEDLPKPLEREE